MGRAVRRDLLGVSHDLPTLPPWPTRALTRNNQLKLSYGTAIVLTGVEAVKELMDRRSAATVDRPPNHMADEIAGTSALLCWNPS